MNLLNHWGVDVGSKEVDAAHANALKHKEKYKIRQVLPVVMQHGVYSFYMEDLDHNWWEIQYYPGCRTRICSTSATASRWRTARRWAS